MNVLLLSGNRVDRVIIDAFKEGLESSGANTLMMTEIVHIGLSTYNWETNAFIAEIMLKELEERINQFPGDLIIILFYPEIEFQGKNIECIKKGRLLLVSLENMRKRTSLKDYLEHVKSSAASVLSTPNFCTELN
ncbi:MAG: hypothetical protein QXR57_00830 [Metallosphaera sp.]|uniref:hypothetical protein n=1 Tax=Metallosphaera sp. TaxID=2020860 RepID=UPI0031604608